MRSVLAGALLAAGMANAHLVAWSVGMYCKDVRIVQMNLQDMTVETCRPPAGKYWIRRPQRV